MRNAIQIRTHFASSEFSCDAERRGKGHPTTGYEGPLGEQTYSSTLALASALDGVGGQRHAPAAVPPGKTRYPPQDGA